MTLPPEGLRDRSTMRTILCALNISHEADPGIRLRLSDILSGFDGSTVPPETGEVRARLSELIQRKMVDVHGPADGERPTARSYTITAKGLTFVRHDYPFDEIDEFSGS